MPSLLALFRLVLLALAALLGAGLLVSLSPVLLCAFLIHRVCLTIEYFRPARKGAKKGKPGGGVKNLLHVYSSFQKFKQAPVG